MSPLTPFLADKNDTESVVFPEGGVYTLDLEGAIGIYRCQWGEFTFPPPSLDRLTHRRYTGLQ